MLNSRMLSVHGALLLAAIVCAESWEERAMMAQEPPQQTVDWDAVIDGLASRNAAPELVELSRSYATSGIEYFGKQPLFAEDYDWDERDRVLKVRSRILNDDDPLLWDYFIKHLNDRRYAVTLGEPPSYSKNVTVGDICWKGFSSRVSFASTVTKRPQGQQGNTLALKLDFDIFDWRKKHPDTPLYELQIALCERALEKIPTEKRLSEEARARNARKIQGYLDKLRETRKPLFFRVGSLDSYERYNARLAQQIREEYERQQANPKPKRNKKHQEREKGKGPNVT